MTNTRRLPDPPQWLLWIIVIIALVCAIAQCQAVEPLRPIVAVYDESQLAQAKDIATARAARKLLPLAAILNVNSGPGDPSTRKRFLNWQPVDPITKKPAVLNIGYIDLDDEDSHLRSAADIRADILAWRGTGVVPMIFLDDAHAWDLKQKSDDLKKTVAEALKGTGYTAATVILNPGGPLTKPSAWQRTAGLVCDFEDPIPRLKPASIGPVWLSFVVDRAAAQSLINVARERKTVRFIGFDLLRNWKTPGKEWQTPLTPDLVALLMSL